MTSMARQPSLPKSRKTIKSPCSAPRSGSQMFLVGGYTSFHRTKEIKTVVEPKPSVMNFNINLSKLRNGTVTNRTISFKCEKTDRTILTSKLFIPQS